MKVDEMLKIFEFEDIQIDVIDADRFEEKHELYDDFHKLECRGGVWSMILEKHERRHGEESKKTFNNKDEAIGFFCFYKLERKYFSIYIREAINKYYNIGRDTFSLKELLEIFNELGIKDDLYGINSYQGNAINLIIEQNGKYSVAFLDWQKNIILITKEFDLAGALFVMFKWVYLIHIMKTHLAEMQKVGLLINGVSNEDYKVLLT